MSDSLLAAVRHSQNAEVLLSLLESAHVRQELNKPGASGVNALGLAVWRNHAGLVEALLGAGADPDARDGESGWSPLHRSLHSGQLRIAAALLAANASLNLPDWRGRSPLDLLSVELKEYLAAGPDGAADGDVFAWGNGNNYTLGTGSTDVQEHPARVESLHDQQVVIISAAKFHSAAVTADGQLLTWGWGRGGRLGHPDAHVHSGEGAVIAPLVVSALGKRQVAAVAAAKHHTVLCTSAGEVYTMGSNRHGQLGYAIDSQPTPRRVSSLRQRVVAVAAANKHSVAVTAGGDVYTWGSNVLGQLGYGTSDSTSNAAPRMVEAMKGKRVVAAAAAKRHTLVLTAGGEVYTWGHRGVSPRRVQLAGVRDAVSLDGAPISFHRGHNEVSRPVAAAICAGAAHSSALTTTGLVLTWRSADPALQVQEVGGALTGKRVVSIAAGKYRTAAVSDEGDVYMWEGRSDYFPAEGRQPGSGSKKPASATKARPIPGGSGRISLGGEGPALGRSPYGSHSYGDSQPAGGSYGSHSRRAGSFIERFAREREAAAGGHPGSWGAAGSAGRGGLELGSAIKSARLGDTFERIRPERVEGLKRAVAVTVGEKHSLAVQRWSAAQLEGMSPVPWLAAAVPVSHGTVAAALAAEEERWYQHAVDGLVDSSQLTTPRGLAVLEAEASVAESAATASPSPSPSPGKPSPVRPGPRRARPAAGTVGVPSLQRICEEEVARRLVDPRTCLQVLEYADLAGAEVLRAYCLAVAVCNLDAVLLEAGGAFETLAPHLLAELEQLYKLRLAGAGTQGSPSRLAAVPEVAEPAEPESEGNSDGEGSAARPQRRAGSQLQPGRRPTAAALWLGDADLNMVGLPPGVALPPDALAGGSSFRDREEAESEAAAQRLLRTLGKKLQQIEHLQTKAAAGAPLDSQQRAKVEQRPVILSALAALESGMALDDVRSILRAAGREGEEELETCGSGSGSVAPGSSSKAAAGGGAQQAKGRGKRSAQKAAAPEVAAAAEAAEAEAAALAAAVAAAAEAEELEAAEALLGSSPPASSLVPAFGAAGSAAAAADQPRTPAAQVKSLVGFATSTSAAAGLAGAAALAQQQQQAQLGRTSSATKPKSAAKRKGALSMFLRGALEQLPAAGEADAGSSGPGASPHAGASGSSGAQPAPAWGTKPAPPAVGATSLKAILDQEAAAAAVPSPRQPPQGSASKPPTPAGMRLTPGSGIKTRPALESPTAAAAASGGPLRLSLASFIQSSPMAVQRKDSASPPPAAWGGNAGGSPPSRHPTSFRAIQEEQEAAQPARPPPGTSPPAVSRLGSGLPPWRPPVGAPPAVVGGAGGASLLGTSPSGSGNLFGTSPLARGSSFTAAPIPQHSKWYIPEESLKGVGKSLVSIQSEEEALQELAKVYGSDNVHMAAEQDWRSPGLPRPGGRSAGGDPAATQQPEQAEAEQPEGQKLQKQRPPKRQEGKQQARKPAVPPLPLQQEGAEGAEAGPQQRQEQQQQRKRSPRQQQGQQQASRRPRQPKEGGQRSERRSPFDQPAPQQEGEQPRHRPQGQQGGRPQQEGEQPHHRSQGQQGGRPQQQQHRRRPQQQQQQVEAAQEGGTSSSVGQQGQQQQPRKPRPKSAQQQQGQPGDQKQQPRRGPPGKPRQQQKQGQPAGGQPRPPRRDQPQPPQQQASAAPNTPPAAPLPA